MLMEEEPLRSLLNDPLFSCVEKREREAQADNLGNRTTRVIATLLGVVAGK